jgi:hypothetical protein
MADYEPETQKSKHSSICIGFTITAAVGFVIVCIAAIVFGIVFANSRSCDEDKSDDECVMVRFWAFIMIFVLSGITFCWIVCLIPAIVFCCIDAFRTRSDKPPAGFTTFGTPRTEAV